MTVPKKGSDGAPSERGAPGDNRAARQKDPQGLDHERVLLLVEIVPVRSPLSETRSGQRVGVVEVPRDAFGCLLEPGTSASLTPGTYSRRERDHNGLPGRSRLSGYTVSRRSLLKPASLQGF